MTTQIFGANASLWLGLADTAAAYQPLRFKSATFNHNTETEDITHGDNAAGTMSVADVGKSWTATVNQCVFEDTVADDILLTILDGKAEDEVYPFLMYRKDGTAANAISGECMLSSVTISGRSTVIMADLNFLGRNVLFANTAIQPTASPALSNESKVAIQHNTTIKQAATTGTAITDEPMSQVGTGARTQFRITHLDRRVLDKTVTPVVKVGGSSGTVVTSTNYTVDYLSGTITAVGAFTFGSGDVVITASYFALTDIAEARDFDINISYGELPSTTIASQRGANGYGKTSKGLKNVTVSVSQFDEPNTSGFDMINNRDQRFIIETKIGHDTTGYYITTVGWFKPTSRSTSLSPENLNEASLEYAMATDSSVDNSFTIYKG